jgi:hypothetical protein
MAMSNIPLLLDEVGSKINAIRAARHLFARELAPDFHLFDYLRRDEMGLSSCIAALLDPKGTHAQGAVFLDEFLKLIGHSSSELPRNTCCNVSVEKQIDKQRRIDIFIELDDLIVGIENKPWASDQVNQLSDYATYLKSFAGNKKWRLIYLCDRAVSATSISEKHRIRREKSGNLLNLDFTTISAWLHTCATKTKPLAVRVFIEELEKFVRSRIIGEVGMSEKIEIQRAILASETSLASALQIANEMKSIKEQMLKGFFVELEEALKTYGMQLDGNLTYWKACTGLNIKFYGEQRIMLRFEFESANLGKFFWGIRRDKKDYFSEETWGKINRLMGDRFKNCKAWPWWPWYSDLPDQYFDEACRHWDNSEKPWLMLKNGQMVKQVITIAMEVREVFNGQENLLK